MAVAEGSMVTPNVRLVRRLGEGGMGSVWVADHLTLETQVAVKFISAELLRKGSSNVLARFKREAKAAARIKSPFVVQTHDQGVMEDGTPYIVMELMEGCSLAERVERDGSLTLQETALILRQVAKALLEAHRLGVVHRDIKPDNIFLTTSADELLVKVLDFGIAKETRIEGGSVITGSGAMVGTPVYMSPEQVLDSKDVDSRSDLWALGVVAYELLTGRLPFWATKPSQLVLAICDGKFTPPSTFQDAFGEEIDAWFERALARRPEDRFESAIAMVDALDVAMKRMSLAETAPVAPAEVAEPDDQETERLPAAVADAEEEATERIANVRSEEPLVAPVEARTGGDKERRGSTYVVAATVAAVLSLTLLAAYAIGELREPTPPADTAAAPAPAAEAESTESDAEEAPPEVPEPDRSVKPPVRVVKQGTAPTPTVSADAAPTPPVSADAGPTGRLTLACKPACDEVTIDGNKLGRSLAFNHRLPVGSHRVVLERAGGRSKTVVVLIREGELTNRVVRMPADDAEGEPAEF